MENKETLQTSTLISLRRNSKQRFKLRIWEITVESISSVKKANVTSILRGANQFSDPVQNKINYFFPDSVVTTSVVIGSIFFASDQLFRVKQLSVGTSANLILNMKF